MDVLFTPVTPPPLPGPPTNVSATAGLGQATVNWTEPSKGGVPASYRITPYIGASAQTPVTISAPATSKTITGLNGGTTYAFTVTVEVLPLSTHSETTAWELPGAMAPIAMALSMVARAIRRIIPSTRSRQPEG